MIMPRKYIKFTGKYADLKPMGFEFQKLYAANYMQWHNDGMRVWKRAGDVSIDDFTNYEGNILAALLEVRGNKELFDQWKSWSGGVQFVFNNETREIDAKKTAHVAHRALEDDYFRTYDKVDEMFPSELAKDHPIGMTAANDVTARFDKYKEATGVDLNNHEYHLLSVRSVPFTLIKRLFTMIDAGQIEVAER